MSEESVLAAVEADEWWAKWSLERDAHKSTMVDGVIALARAERAEARCRELETALREYGGHKASCAASGVAHLFRGASSPACDCGLARVLSSEEGTP